MSTHRSDEEAVTLDWLSEGAGGGDEESGRANDIFTTYVPPFDLTSDMLFALALCPTTPLSQAFPGVPFLSLVSKTPLLLWFSRITEMCYHDTVGAEHCIGGSSAGLYHELNVVAFLRERALFVPGIYATSELTILVGHRYGMPKQPTTMQVQVDDKWFHSEMRDGARQSFVRARLLGSGKGTAKILSRFLPRWTWLVRFPSGSGIGALIQSTPRVQMVRVQAGQLALKTEWLPQVLSLLPVGLYLPGLRMQLPSPQDRIGSARRYSDMEPLHSEQHCFQLPRSPLHIAMFLSAVLVAGAVVAWLKKRPLRRHERGKEEVSEQA